MTEVYDFTSVGSSKIMNRSVFYVKCWENCTNKDLEYLIGNEVTIDGKRWIVAALERFAVQAYTKDQTFGIMVKEIP